MTSETIKNQVKKEWMERNPNPKSYEELKKFFSYELDLTNEEKNSVEVDGERTTRVWLLFAETDDKKNKCLQVAQSKDTQSEVTKVIELLQRSDELTVSGIKYKNSAFYSNVCPAIDRGNYIDVLYKMIGGIYTHFKICFLDVDMYLGIVSRNQNYMNDLDMIIEICKAQYAEAKIAYQTLAVYWRLVSSNVDGQTIKFIADNAECFKDGQIK